jgi:hypothetical protein
MPPRRKSGRRKNAPNSNLASEGAAPPGKKLRTSPQSSDKAADKPAKGKGKAKGGKKDTEKEKGKGKGKGKRTE